MSRRLIAACALISAAALTPAQSIATGTVGPNEINAAVLPIDAAGAVLPIDVRDSIDPLEVQRTQGATSVITVSADVLFAFNKPRSRIPRSRRSPTSPGGSRIAVASR